MQILCHLNSCGRKHNISIENNHIIEWMIDKDLTGDYIMVSWINSTIKSTLFKIPKFAQFLLHGPHAPVSQANRESADSCACLKLKRINYVIDFLACCKTGNLNADKVKMNLFGWVLFVALEISLVDYASSSACPKLNSTLFTADCVRAGYNVTAEFYPNGAQKELSDSFARMRRKFNNCSSLSSLMTCSVQLPKCPTAPLPCKEACKNFVSECHNSSSEHDGLIALFRGICELLHSDKCLSKPNQTLNDSASGK